MTYLWKYFHAGFKKEDISVSYVITVYPQVESIRLISVIHKTSYFVNEKLIEIIKNTDPVSLHGYTSASGNMKTRDAIARLNLREIPI